MNTLLNLAAAGLLALASSQAAGAMPTEQLDLRAGLESLFPTPSAPLECSSSANSLSDLLDALSESTGVLYVATDPRAAAALREPRELSLPTGPIAAADAYTFVESQLVARRFFLTCSRDVAPTTVGVHRIGYSPPGAELFLEATRDELGFIRRHPALQFSTTLEIEHLEARIVATQLKELWSRGYTCVGVAPVGFSQTVALFGAGSDVAAAADLLRTRDAEAGAAKLAAQRAAAHSVLDLSFPAPRGSLDVPADASSLAELLASLSQATGVTYAIDASAKEAFEAAQLSLQRSMTLQPSEAYAWIESQLLDNGFGLTCDAEHRPATVQVRPANSSAATDADCLLVGLGDLDFVRRHPALGFSIALKLENIDAEAGRTVTGPGPEGRVLGAPGASKR